MNLEQRPPFLYSLIFVCGLLVYSIQQPDKIWLALGAVLLILLSYRINWCMIHHPYLQGLILILVFLFSYFILHGGDKPQYLTFYNTRFIYPLCTSNVIILTYFWYQRRSPHFDWVLFLMGILLLFSSVSWQVTKLRYIYQGAVGFFILVFLLSRVFTYYNHSVVQKYKKFPRFNHAFHLFVIILITGFSSIIYLNITHFLDNRVFQLINDAFLSGSRLSWTGFSGTTVLRGNMNVQLSEDIVMSVESPHMLHHLRGNVLVTYKKGRWFPPEEKKSLPKHLDKHLPEQIDTRFPDFRFVKTQEIVPSDFSWIARFRYEGYFEGRVFIPNSTSLVGIWEQDFETNQYGILKQKKFNDFPIYAMLGSTQEGVSVNGDYHSILQENIQISSDIRQALQPLARQITQGANSDIERARKIETWFHQNFTYSLQIGDIPVGVDPVVDFILNKKPAFCSWFASGMVLMLRSIDIPAHIASGWYGMEYNPIARIWVVREKDAHDWVEVLDKTHHRWLIFDSTPANQLQEIVGRNQAPSLFLQVKDWLALLVKSVGRFVLKNDLGEKLNIVKTLAFQILKSPWTYAVFVLVLLLNYLLKRRKQEKRLISPVPETEAMNYKQDTEITRLSSLFVEKLEHHGIQNDPHLTLAELLDEFSNRSDMPDGTQKLAQQIVEQIQVLRFAQKEERSIEELDDAIKRFSE